LLRAQFSQPSLEERSLERATVPPNAKIRSDSLQPDLTDQLRAEPTGNRCPR
jgi:hypothetical protein